MAMRMSALISRHRLRATAALLLGALIAAGSGCTATEAQPSAQTTAAATTPSPGPALWSFGDDDTTVYLFGTVHLLKPDTQWLTPHFEAAWQASDVLYMEANTDSAEVQAGLARKMQEIGVYRDGSSLLDRLSDEERATVAAAADALGVPLPAIAPLKPWLAGLQLSVMQLVKSGYDPASGVETVLSGDPVIADKQRRYFETADQQIEFFEQLTQADQVAMLVAGSRAVVEEPEALDELVRAWSRGDVAELASLMSSVDAFGSEAVYQLLLTDRNRDWVPRIEALLSEPGTHMIAVGAGHLAGTDSVIAMLERRGHSVTRR